MKSIFKILMLCLLVTAVVSCSLDDDGGTNFVYKLTPITAVEMPDTVVRGQNYDIKVSFERPSECYLFSGFNFTKNNNERVVGAVSTVIGDRDSCVPYDSVHIQTETLKFMVVRSDYYVFKFWKGVDSIGQPEYITDTIIVSNSEIGPH